ncbi:hypothetical protein KIN20_021510, partial [Parelaphostrongylus tenuis]
LGFPSGNVGLFSLSGPVGDFEMPRILMLVSYSEISVQYVVPDCSVCRISADHLIQPPAYTQNLSIWDTGIIRHRRQRSRRGETSSGQIRACFRA